MLAGDEDDVLIDRVAVRGSVPSRVTELGDTSQLRLSPLGTLQVSATVPLNPPTGVSVNVDIVDCPGDTVAEVGEVLILKFGGIWPALIGVPGTVS